MNDNAFRWIVVTALTVMALSLYVVSAMTVIGVSRRLPPREPRSTPET